MSSYTFYFESTKFTPKLFQDYLIYLIFSAMSL